MNRLFSKHFLSTFLPRLIPVALLILLITMKISNFSLLAHMQLKIFDAFQQWSPRDYSEQPVRIIDIDDESLKRIGQWPWPRNKMAELVNKLHEAGATVIVLDVVFAEADRTSPAQLKALWPENKALGNLANTLPDHDQLFAEAIKQSNVVTGFVLTSSPSGLLPKNKAGYVFAGENPAPYLLMYKGAVNAMPQFEQVATGNGALNSSPDDDGILRKISLLYRVGEELYPSLTMEALRIAQGASSYIIKSVGASGEEGFGSAEGITHIRNGEFIIPTTANGQLWVHYTPYKASRYIPAWKILGDTADPEKIAGHIVILGTSAAGLKDIRTTPLNPVTSGVEVHAQAMEQVLAGDYLYRPDWVEGAEIALMVIAGALMVYMIAKASALWQALFTCVVLVGAGGASWYAYQYVHYLIDPVIPSIGIILVYMSESLRKFLMTEKERKHIRTAFSHYMSPVLVEQLASSPEKLKLGGEMKEITVLFSDIRGFTTISEQFDAEGLTRFMNRFLTPVTEVILTHKGTIDKYIGDCVMAFWNAPVDNPHHTEDACNAALGMLAAVRQFNREQEKHAEGEGFTFVPVQLGIGINTGQCCVGNMGSEQRFDYSVLGDDVNLASRIEGQTKYYGVDIIIGEATRETLQDFAVLALDCIQVKGKTKPAQLYALFGGKELAENPYFKQLEEAMDIFHLYYCQKKWQEAKMQLLSCVELAIQADEALKLDGIIRLFNERIDHFIAHPPEEDWDGVFKAKVK